jgi:diguanylate cyclase (GGDEF)-like protein
VVLLPETVPTGAFVVAEKIRQGVAAMRTVERGDAVTVSVSIGLAAWPDDGATLDQLLDGVDEAMYAAKQHGRNRIGAVRTVGRDDARYPAGIAGDG